jgi:hypothetical protein
MQARRSGDDDGRRGGRVTDYGFSYMPPSTPDELAAEGQRVHDAYGLTRADVAAWMAEHRPDWKREE